MSEYSGIPRIPRIIPGWPLVIRLHDPGIPKYPGIHEMNNECNNDWFCGCFDVFLQAVVK